MAPPPQISGHQNRLPIWRELWSAPIGAHQFGPSLAKQYVTLHGLLDILVAGAWFQVEHFVQSIGRGLF